LDILPGILLSEVTICKHAIREVAFNIAAPHSDLLAIFNIDHLPFAKTSEV
jgi:hypothetical protein